jgi:pimeloyl-ACP methyl ester carboxylesterase
MKEIIHFAHANGFPAGTYSKLFSFLEDEFEINFIEQHGHDPKFPVTKDWEFLRQELREEIKTRYEKPIIGVGHSLGGILHLLVAAENPELYGSIVLLDAPIISRLSSLFIKYAKKTNLMKKYSPSLSTRFRRSVWKNEEEAFQHFHKKEKFRAFDKDVLRDYIKYGTLKTEDGIKLSFEPNIEAKIYETLPHHLPKLRGKLKMPIVYIGGTTSREARLARLGFMKKHFPIRFYFLKGSHLFPFEKPKKTANILKKLHSEKLI